MTQGPGTYLNLAANGSILPMSFVKLDPSAPDSCLQCGATETPIGIAGTWTRYAGGTPANDLEPGGGLEATIGEFPQVASLGCVVPLICGNTGTWVSGNKLKPDASGYGTPCVANTDVAGAIALEGATPGGYGRVLVLVSGTAGSLALMEAESKMPDEEEGLPGQDHDNARNLTRLIREEEAAKTKSQEEAAEKASKEEEEKKSRKEAKPSPQVKPESQAKPGHQPVHQGKS